MGLHTIMALDGLIKMDCDSEADCAVKAGAVLRPAGLQRRCTVRRRGPLRDGGGGGAGDGADVEHHCAPRRDWHHHITLKHTPQDMGWQLGRNVLIDRRRLRSTQRPTTPSASTAG